MLCCVSLIASHRTARRGVTAVTPPNCVLSVQGLSRTPIDTQGFSSALRLMETTCADSFELFYGLFRYNPHSHTQLRKLRDSFAEVERQVCACAWACVLRERSRDNRKLVGAKGKRWVRGSLGGRERTYVRTRRDDPIRHDL